jgi:hypothetical protein
MDDSIEFSRGERLRLFRMLDGYTDFTKTIRQL